MTIPNADSEKTAKMKNNDTEVNGDAGDHDAPYICIYICIYIYICT